LERLARQDKLGEVERARFFESFFEGEGRDRRLRDKFDEFDKPDHLEDALNYLFGGSKDSDGVAVLADVESYRGTDNDRAYIRQLTSTLIGWFTGAVALEGDQLKIDPQIRAQVAVLKELAWFYVINDPSLTTIQFGQRRVIKELHDVYKKAVEDGDWSLFPRAQQELLEAYGG